MKACQLKSIQKLIDMHDKRESLLEAFITEARVSTGNLCAMIEHCKGSIHESALEYIMISYGNLLTWMQELDKELKVEEGAA